MTTEQEVIDHADELIRRANDMLAQLDRLVGDVVSSLLLNQKGVAHGR